MSFNFHENNKDKIPEFTNGTFQDFQNLNKKSTNQIGPSDPIFQNNLFEENNQNKSKINLPPIGARFNPIKPLDNKNGNNTFQNHHRIYKDFQDKK